MKAIHCLMLGLLSLNFAAASAQGRPAGGDAAAEHHHHGDAAAPPPGMPMGGGGASRGTGRDWTRMPIIVPAMGGERERGTLAFTLKNSDAASLDVFAPDTAAPEARRQSPVGPDGAKVAMLPKIGNFYWITAREEKGDRISIASTPAYFSEPGPAPTRLLAQPKSELEIVPQPLPREHGNYRESEKWSFLLRFKGAPLPNTAVKMETELGTKTTVASNAEGLVTVLFPRDFKAAQREGAGGAHGGPRRAKFVLAAEHEADGKHYLAAFNATYSPDADRDRSLGWGAAFGLLGMVVATPLLRRRPAKDNQGEKHA